MNREEIKNEETMLEYMSKKGWVQTDASCNQYRKDISKTVFLFREDRVINPETKETEVYESDINIEDYTEDQMIDACSSFGYNKDEVLQWLFNGENTDLIAECIFENEN